MKRYVNNAKGISLVELLAAIAISSIIIASIYGVFLSGLNAYKRINIENQLRSEADYIVAAMMNRLYEFAPDGIEMDKTTKTQIEFVKDKDIDISLGMFKKLPPNRLERFALALQDGTITAGEEQLKPDRLKIVMDKSEFSYSCAKQEGNICRGGVVTIRLAVQDRDHDDPDDLLYIKPFTLKTEFGF